MLTLKAHSLFAQDSLFYSENKLAAEEIKDLAEIAKYEKTVNKLRLKEPDIGDTDFEPSNISFGMGAVARALLFVLIGALVLFILYTIFSGIKVDKKIQAEAHPEFEEIEDIDVIDTESGLETALKAENYREAVRMLFIKLLQVLVFEKSIDWKPEKTNRDYLKEMKTHPKVQHFNNLVLAYERIWYGSKPIDKLFFDFLRADFDKFYSTENMDLDVKE